MIILGYTTLSNSKNNQEVLGINDTFIVEKTKIIGEYKKNQEEINYENIDVIIKNGLLKTENKLIFSVNNLISYKEIITPRVLFLYEDSPIKNKNYFLENSGYDVNHLESLIKNTIFTNLEELKYEQKIPAILPINETIKKTFYINCISQYKIFNKTCDYYIGNFLNDFFIYNISNDYEGINDIFNEIKKTKYKDAFCQQISEYINYSKDTNQKIKQIFIECGDNYYKVFENLNFFMEINKQLNEGYISSSTYKSQDLNEYKLLSYQQIIYNDIINEKINNLRFESYINYLKSILKKEEAIENIYFDIIYRFNNYYINTKLNKMKYDTNESNRIKIDNILNLIKKINEGNQLEGYKGLKNKIINKNIQLEKKEDQNAFEIEDGTTKSIKNLKSLSFLKIINEEIIDDKIKISGYFQIKQTEGFKPLYIGFIIDTTGGQDNVVDFEINDYKELNNIVKKIIENQNYNIIDVYQYIQENIDLFTSENSISTCDIISEKFEGEKRGININILECEPDSIDIMKTQNNENSTNKTYYNIIMNNFNISGIKISDKTIENEILKYLKNINTNSLTIGNIISEIVFYEKKQESITQQGSNNIIITIEDFQRYLGDTPTDIAEAEGKILAEFSIKGIKFVGVYDIEKKIIESIYFKYDTRNDEVEGNTIKREDLIINGFSIKFDEENQNLINEIKIDPLAYIKKINETVLLKYQQLKYK